MNASNALAFSAGETFEGTLGARRAARVLIAANDGAQRVAGFLEARGHAYALAATAEAVLAQLKSGRFDLVVSTLDDADGLELLRQVRRAMPGLPVIMIAQAVELDGQHLDFASSIKRELCGDNAASRLAGLTARERQVLSLIVAGRANKVIAYELAISPRTVENHRARVMEKLRVKSVAELVRLALGVDGFVLPSANDTGLQRVPATA